MTQLQLKSLLGKVNAILERSNNFFGYVFLKKSEMTALIEEIVACIPADIREAELIISRSEDIKREAENRAERIIQDARKEQARLISDNEIMHKLQEEVTKRKQQINEYCENVQTSASNKAEEINTNAIREAARIQEDSENYAEQIFNDMANNIGQILANVNYCQRALAEKKAGRLIRTGQSSENQNNNPETEEEETAQNTDE